MKVNNPNLGERVFRYNFAAHGGAIGTINLATYFPNYIQPYLFQVRAIDLPTSAGAATISFGWQLSDGSGGDVDDFFPVTNFNTWVAPEEVISGTDFFNVPGRLNSGGRLTMSIAAAALTAGILEATFLFIQYQQ